MSDQSKTNAQEIQALEARLAALKAECLRLMVRLRGLEDQEARRVLKARRREALIERERLKAALVAAARQRGRRP